jgi:ribosomal protein L44E
MDKQKEEKASQTTKKVSAKVKCPHCGKEIEAEVEIPEPPETPKITWLT